MKQTTNTAATALEQVNAMPAATWGWLKMNQTKLELSDELAAAPAETIEVEGLTSSLLAWQTRSKPPWTPWPCASPSAALPPPVMPPTAPALRPKPSSMCPPPPSTRPVPLSWRRISPR